MLYRVFLSLFILPTACLAIDTPQSNLRGDGQKTVRELQTSAGMCPTQLSLCQQQVGEVPYAAWANMTASASNTDTDAFALITILINLATNFSVEGLVAALEEVIGEGFILDMVRLVAGLLEQGREMVATSKQGDLEGSVGALNELTTETTAVLGASVGDIIGDIFGLIVRIFSAIFGAIGAAFGFGLGLIGDIFSAIFGFFAAIIQAIFGFFGSSSVESADCQSELLQCQTDKFFMSIIPTLVQGAMYTQSGSA